MRAFETLCAVQTNQKIGEQNMVEKNKKKFKFECATDELKIVKFDKKELLNHEC